MHAQAVRDLRDGLGFIVRNLAGGWAALFGAKGRCNGKQKVDFNRKNPVPPATW